MYSTYVDENKMCSYDCKIVISDETLPTRPDCHDQ